MQAEVPPQSVIGIEALVAMLAGVGPRVLVDGGNVLPLHRTRLEGCTADFAKIGAHVGVHSLMFIEVGLRMALFVASAAAELQGF